MKRSKYYRKLSKKKKWEYNKYNKNMKNYFKSDTSQISK